MNDKDVATIEFVDQDSGSDAFVIIRVSPNLVVLSVSIAVDGDFLVAMRHSDFVRLLEAMQAAATIARPTPEFSEPNCLD